MTPVSFVKTTEAYDASLVIIIWQTSYDSGILVYLWVIPGIFFQLGSLFGKYFYRNELKQVGLISASDQTVRAVYNCNSFSPLFKTIVEKKTRNVTVCNKCPRRSLVHDTLPHYPLSFCDVSLNLLQ